MRSRSTVPPLALMLAAANVTMASAQDGGNKASAPEASVALDQLSTSTNVRAGPDRAAELEVSQPPRQPRATVVTSNEITDRAEGRTIATSALQGDDRCDATKNNERTELCRKRIEARAGQFTRPAASPVTAEGRLLMLIKPNGANPSGRQLGAPSGLNDPNGPAEQLAGALRDRASQDSNTNAGQPKPAEPNALPPGVPTTVVLPTK